MTFPMTFAIPPQDHPRAAVIETATGTSLKESP